MSGYRIIDLLNLNISTEGGMTTIDGIYNKIAETKCPIKLVNIIIDDARIKDRFVPVYIVGTAYLLCLGCDINDINFIMVDNEDRCTYVSRTYGSTGGE